MIVETDLGPGPIKSRPFRLVPALLLILLIFSAGAYGFWRYIYYPKTPRHAVERLIESGRKKDYEQIYDLVKITGPLKAAVRGPQDLKEYAARFPGLIPNVRDYRIIGSTVKGNRAAVTVEATLGQAETTRRSTVAFELVRDEGIWRIDGDWILKEAVRHGLGGAILDTGVE